MTLLDRGVFGTALHIADYHHGQRKFNFSLLPTGRRYIFDIDTFFGRNGSAIDIFSHALNTKLWIYRDPKAYSRWINQQLSKMTVDDMGGYRKESPQANRYAFDMNRAKL
ncbi:hypothetical protein RIMD111065_25650 [Aeromonas hydrophila]|nr:hypothetical protein RIMD111065_25650 [Aeromonas hydrophila]